MKIAFYMNTVLEQGGGLEKYFIETSCALSNIDGIEVDIVSMDENFSLRLNKLLGFYFFKKHNITISELIKEPSESILKRLGKVGYYKYDNFSGLKKKLSHYDVIYSKNELLEASVLKYFGYKNLPPVIFGCHTPVYYAVADSVHSKLHNFLYNGFIYNWLASGVRAFHVANASDERLLEKLFPKKKVFKIYNPFNFPQFSKNLKEHTFDFKFDTSKKNILWIARLTEQKGVVSLVKIIDEINKTNLKEKIVFNIVGSGQLEEEIKELKKRWGNVNFFGHVEYCFLPSIYSRNDLFISTSKWESLPFNILEAQAIGLPAIAFDIPGPRDIINNEISGFLVETEQMFCERIRGVIDGECVFDKDVIKDRVGEIFSPKSIYLKLYEMFQYVIKEK